MPGSANSSRYTYLREYNRLDIWIFLAHSHQLFQKSFELRTGSPVLHIGPRHDGHFGLSLRRHRRWGSRRRRRFLTSLGHVNLQLFSTSGTPQDIIAADGGDVELHAAPAE